MPYLHGSGLVETVLTGSLVGVSATVRSVRDRLRRAFRRGSTLRTS